MIFTPPLPPPPRSALAASVSSRARLASILTLALSFLAACGGGGGGSGGDNATGPVGASVTLTGGAIALDGANASGTATCTTTGSEGGPVSFKLNGTATTCSTSGTPVTLVFGANTLVASDAAGKQLGKVTFTVACAVGDWNGSACKDPVSATVTLSSGKIALDGKTADGTATCTEKGSQGGPVSYKLDGKSLSACTETGTAVALTFGQNTLTAYDAAGKQLGEAIVDVTCADGTWNGTACKTKLVYSDVLISYWGATSGWPRKTLADGSQLLATNKTKYVDFLTCLPADKPSADGMIPHSCHDRFTADQHNDITLDPITMELKDLPAAPVGVTYVPLTYDASRIPPGHPTWGTAAQFTNGDYAFVDGLSGSILRRLSGTTESVIYAGTFAKDGSCFLVMIYSSK